MEKNIEVKVSKTHTSPHMSWSESIVGVKHVSANNRTRTTSYSELTLQIMRDPEHPDSWSHGKFMDLDGRRSISGEYIPLS